MVSALKKSRAGVKPLKVLKTVLRWAFNIVIALIFFIPFYWMVITSLKTHSPGGPRRDHHVPAGDPGAQP